MRVVPAGPCVPACLHEAATGTRLYMTTHHPVTLRPIPFHTARWWTLLEEAAVEWDSVPHPLPSDCRYREDLAALAAGDVKAAQAAKEALEQRQRADAKLRKAGGGSG